MCALCNATISFLLTAVITGLALAAMRIGGQVTPSEGAVAAFVIAFGVLVFAATFLHLHRPPPSRA